MTLAETKSAFLARHDNEIPTVTKQNPLGKRGDMLTLRPLMRQMEAALLAEYRKASDFSHAKQVRLWTDAWITGVYQVRAGGAVLFDSLSEGLAH